VAAPDLSDIKRRMDGALETLRKELAGLRTGRASVNLLDPVTVEAYGTKMPLSQVGTISVPEPRMLTVTVWDKGQVKAVEKAIRDAGLGLNPMSEGTLVRVPIPDLTQDRRNELVKVASKYAEQARVSVRNVRRDGMEMLKGLEKKHELSQDEHRKWHDEVQALTDSHIKKVDETLATKEKEIKQV
jgi:ribosome recycling factor